MGTKALLHWHGPWKVHIITNFIDQCRVVIVAVEIRFSCFVSCFPCLIVQYVCVIGTTKRSLSYLFLSLFSSSVVYLFLPFRLFWHFFSLLHLVQYGLDVDYSIVGISFHIFSMCLHLVL